MAVYGQTSEAENFLEGCQASNIIPDYATIDELAYHVIEASEADYNQIMMECGVIELAYVEENHQEMIYESGKIKELINSAESGIKKLWSHVQEMFEKAIKTIEDKAQEFREKVMKKIDKDFLAKRKDNIKNDKDFGATFDFEDIKSKSDDNKGKIESYQKKLDDAYSRFKSNDQTNESLVKEADETFNTLIDNCLHGLTNGSATTISNLSTIIKEQIRKKSIRRDGSWVKKNYATIVEEVTKYPETKRALKSDYAKLKKQFNESIKNIKKANNGRFFEANIFTKAVSANRKLLQITTACQQAVISCLNEKYSFYRSVLFKIIGVKATKDEKSVGESATIDGVSSLFNW